jgi:hypothetical protein
MPTGAKIHVSVYVPPDSSSVYNKNIFEWVECKNGKIETDAKQSKFEAGKNLERAYAQTPIIP